MSRRHTKEPWVPFIRNQTTAIIDEDGNEIVSWMGFDRSEIPRNIQNKNARRIVACVNACKGIPTLALKDEIVRKLIGDVKILLAAIEQKQTSGEIKANAITIGDTIARAEGGKE